LNKSLVLYIVLIGILIGGDCVNYPQEIFQQLKEKGYKLTPQREKMIETLCKYQGHFISVEQLWEIIRQTYQSIHITTIYRNLEVLEKASLVHKIYVDGMYKYGLKVESSHHHHMICKQCGKTKTIDFCPLQEIHMGSGMKEFTVTDHTFELYGYCNQCKNLKQKGE